MDRRPGKMAFDGTNARNPVSRRAVDYYADLHMANQYRLTNNSFGFPFNQSNYSFAKATMIPTGRTTGVIGGVCDQLVHSCENKGEQRRKENYSINVVKWFPDGKKLVTGNSNGKLTLWDGTEFNHFVNIRVHLCAINALCWLHSGHYMISADNNGCVGFWKTNLYYRHMEDDEDIKFQPHTGAIRSVSMGPTDACFCTSGDDMYVKVIDTNKEVVDWQYCLDSEVRCAAWHPHASLIAAGDRAHNVTFMDPRDQMKLFAISTGHRDSVEQLEWHSAGREFLTRCSDKVLRLWDIRNTQKGPIWAITINNVFRGNERQQTLMAKHENNVSSNASEHAPTTFCFHPHLNSVFAVGTHSGALAFFDKDSPSMVYHPGRSAARMPTDEDATSLGVAKTELIQQQTAVNPDPIALGYAQRCHRSRVMCLCYHPAGHLLASSAYDGQTCFYSRYRPGDLMLDTLHETQVNTGGQMVIDPHNRDMQYNSSHHCEILGDAGTGYTINNVDYANHESVDPTVGYRLPTAVERKRQLEQRNAEDRLKEQRMKEDAIREEDVFEIPGLDEFVFTPESDKNETDTNTSDSEGYNYWDDDDDDDDEEDDEDNENDEEMGY